MITVRLNYEDKDGKALKKSKEKSGLSWEKYILLLHENYCRIYFDDQGKKGVNK